jgi:hypothetical protein
MIYVLKSLGYDENDKSIELIKIGYTNNWDKRLVDYKLHNPTIRVLYLCENGNEDDERSLHSYFSEYRFNSYGREWFYYNESIIEFFEENPIEKIRNIFIKPKKELPKFKAWVLKIEEYMSSLEDNKINQEIKTFFEKYKLLKTELERLKFICKAQLSEQARSVIENLVDDRIKSFLTLGPERLRGLSYNITKINKELGIITFDRSNLKNAILREFNVGDKLSKGDIKTKLQSLYINLGYKKTPKAVDLIEWFKLKEIKINTKLSDGSYKRDHGFEILAKK